MRHCGAAIALTVALATSAWARPSGTGGPNGASAPRQPSCLIEVLASEELPGAPIFQTLVRARLRITPQGQPPFERTVERFISWQEPPPRRGHRLTVSCDPASIGALVPY
jgi:hypothetical protein